jgi:hypothetical protein
MNKAKAILTVKISRLYVDAQELYAERPGFGRTTELDGDLDDGHQSEVRGSKFNVIDVS